MKKHMVVASRNGKLEVDPQICTHQHTVPDISGTPNYISGGEDCGGAELHYVCKDCGMIDPPVEDEVEQARRYN